MEQVNYLQFDFETNDQQQLEQLIALLSEQGFEGFEEEEENLKAYISESNFDEVAFTQTLDLFDHIIYTRTSVEHINWNKKWEEDFKPVVIEDFVAIRAAFHQSVSGVEHEIIITPKMSFGTGHHATTHLVIQRMRALHFVNKRVLDFGTGTGILAILAEKLGAIDIWAIDYDEWSILNAAENIYDNKCSGIKTEIMAEIPRHEKFDIVLANINLNVLAQNISGIKLALNEGGYALLSGFLKENEQVMIEHLHSVALTHLSTHQRGDWIVILAKS